MSKFKIGDRIEQYDDNNKVMDRGTVVRIVDGEIWCTFDSNKGEEFYFLEEKVTFGYAREQNALTVETVRTVMKAYQDYAKIEYVPEYAHQEVYKQIQETVKNSLEFKEITAVTARELQAAGTASRIDAELKPVYKLIYIAIDTDKNYVEYYTRLSEPAVLRLVSLGYGVKDTNCQGEVYSATITW